MVALTGHALAGMFEGAKRAGCDAFVTKPCLPEDLVERNSAKSSIGEVVDCQEGPRPPERLKYA